MSRMEEIIRARPELTSLSSAIGSEPAVISFGAGRLAQQGQLTVHLVDRFQRDDTIWEIEDDLRARLQALPGMKSVDVFDFGATPMSSIRASVDVMISGPDLATLDSLGRDVEQRLRDHVRGATTITRSWTMDSEEIGFTADPEKLALYEVSPSTVSVQLQGAVRGMPGSVFRIPNQDGLSIWVQLAPEHREHAGQLDTYPILTPHGPVPLQQLGRIDRHPTASVITRQGLQRTLDISA